MTPDATAKHNRTVALLFSLEACRLPEWSDSRAYYEKQAARYEAAGSREVGQADITTYAPA